jgi:hypothetical protein
MVRQKSREQFLVTVVVYELLDTTVADLSAFTERWLDCVQLFTL